MRSVYALLFVLLIFQFPKNASAQDDAKKIIAVTPFAYAGTRSAKAYASSLTEVVVGSVVKSNRFTVVDRTNFDDIFSEENLQKGESFIEGEVVEQGKKLGAQFIITGNLISASSEPVYKEVPVSKDSEEKKKVLDGYKGKVSFSIKILDVTTGQIMATSTLGNDGSGNFWYFMSTYGTKEEAITEALKSADKPVFQFIDKHFPVSMRIFEITDQKKGRAKEIVITGGSSKGLFVGQNLSIVEVREVTVDGKVLERKKPIGEAVITDIEDENFSKCKVRRSGAELVKEKFDSNANVFVITGQ